MSETMSGGQFLTPAEARQYATDRLIGQRTLLALRIVAITSAVVFVTIGILTDPRSENPIIDSLALGLVTMEVWVLLAVAGLIAMIVCRRPARRQVLWLREAINASAILPILAGGTGLAVGFYHRAPVAIVICGVALVCGMATMVLHYVWRAR